MFSFNLLMPTILISTGLFSKPVERVGRYIVVFNVSKCLLVLLT